MGSTLVIEVWVGGRKSEIMMSFLSKNHNDGGVNIGFASS